MASTQPRCRRHLSAVHYRPSSADTASGRLGSQRRAAEDRRCDTPTDSCHSRAALRHPCTLDRTPCERRPPSPEVRSPPNTSRHQLAYLFTVADSLLVDNTAEHYITLWCSFTSPLLLLITNLPSEASINSFKFWPIWQWQHGKICRLIH